MDLIQFRLIHLPSMKNITGLRLFIESPRRGRKGVQTFKYKQSSDIWSRIWVFPVG